MKENKKIRELIFTIEFSEYLETLDERTKNKFGECFTLLKEVRVLSVKFVKVLVNTDENLYELRVSVGFNEYRSILFSADHDNIIQATRIIILSGFLKKSSKDYDKQIKRAINILNRLEL
jgi:mRNA-degrading endonuclease RelE of RelBE toxin-antitoxin system